MSHMATDDDDEDDDDDDDDDDDPRVWGSGVLWAAGRRILPHGVERTSSRTIYTRV